MVVGWVGWVVGVVAVLAGLAVVVLGAEVVPPVYSPGQNPLHSPQTFTQDTVDNVIVMDAPTVTSMLESFSTAQLETPARSTQTCW